MPIPLIATITRRVQGEVALSHFLVLEGNLDGGYRCLGCGTHIWDRVSPVELVDGGEIDHDASGDCSPLCRTCTPIHAKRMIAGWPSLTSEEASAIWPAVNAEQAAETDRELERYRASALEETQAANAALQLAGSNQGVNGLGKVA